MQQPLLRRLPARPAASFLRVRWGRLLALLALLLTGSGAWAQTTKTLPGDYASFSAAIGDINTNFAAGGVTVNVAAGYVETAPAGGLPLLTAQGTGGATGQIVFQKAGTGANPRISAGVGTSATVDGIVRLSGADYVTFDGIDLLDPSTNATQAAAAEYGYGLFRASAINGCQNNTIRNCVVTMNRSGSASTTGVIYGIYGASTDATGTAVATTSVAGGNSNNKFYTNTVLNTQQGILLTGFNDTVSPYALLDQGNDVGGTSATTGNTIQNFGGVASVITYGIRMVNQNGSNTSYNTLSNAANGGVVSPFTFYGIQVTGGTNASCTVNNNTVTPSQGLNANQVVAIQTALAGTGTTNVNNNTASQTVVATGGVASSGNRFLLINTGAQATLNMTGNNATFNLSSTAATSALSGAAYGVANQGGGTGIVTLSTNNVTYTVSNSSTSAISATCYGVVNSTVALTGSLVMSGNPVIINTSNTSTGTITGALYGTYNAIGVGGTALMSNNTLTHAGTNTGGGTFTSAVAPVYNSGTVTGLLTISGNSYQNGTTATTGIVYGVFANSATNNLLVQNNTLNNLNKTGAGNIVYGYYNFGSAGTGTATIDGNTFTNITVTGATTFYGVYNISSTTQASVVTNNTITGITAGTSASFGIYLASTTYSGAATATGNTVTFTTAGAALTGIAVASQTGTATINTNTVNLTSTAGVTIGINATSIVAQTINGNTITGISGASTVTGIVAGGTSTQGVNQNVIGGLRGTASAIIGLSVSAGTTNTVTRNKLYDYALTGASTVTGLSVSGGTTTTLANNLIGDLRAPAATSATAIAGLQVSGGTTVNVYFNTIYLAASGAATFGSSGIYLSSTTPTVTLIDNIVDNKSTPGTTSGLTVALRRSATAVTGYGSGSNYNLYYAGAPAANQLLYYDGFNSYQTIAAFQTGTGIAPREAASKTEDVQFVSTTGSATTFLHISPSPATQVESGGVAVSGYAIDYDNDPRGPYPVTATNGGGTAPDIGADEGDFIPSDQTPPTITYTTLGNTSSTGNRTLTATITDASGIATGTGAPRIYYRLSTGGTYYSAVATSTAVNGQNNGTYTFTIDYANIGGTPAVGSVIQYYVAAQDASVNNNAGTNPVGGSGINPPGSTPPATPNSYQILGSLAGDYYVLGTAASGSSPGGATREYATLTAAVADYNSKGLGGAVRFLLFSNTQGTETYPITINANGDANATNTLTIKPYTGVTTTLSGSSTGALVLLNGADYVILDGSNTTGGTSRDLTLTNTNAGTSSAVVWGQTTAAADAATNNTVRNLVLTGSGKTATLFGVGFGGTTIATTSLGTGNVNNTVQNNSVGLVQYGIYSLGASAANKNTGTVITQNLLGTNASTPVGYGGIMVGFEDGITISLNSIDNIISAGSPDVTGINVGFVASGISASAFTGNEVTNATIARNRVGVVRNTGTFSAAGIALASAATGTTTIANNFVSGVSANGTSGDFGAGIYLGGGAGTTQVYYNSVSMSGTNGGATAGTYPGIALAIGGSNPIVNVRNNVLANTQTTGTANYNAAIGLAYSTYTNLTSDYNDLYVGTGTYYVVGITGGFATTTPTTQKALSDWRTTTGKDAASKSVDPAFTSLTDLHSNSVDLDNAGTPIASITIDIDGDTRSATTPDIGADEFSYADNQPPTITYTALGNTSSTGNRTLTATITDPSGIATGTGAPRIYYRLSTGGTYYSAVATSAPTSAPYTGSYTFTIDYANIGGTPAVGSVIQYYVAAQDASANNNVATSPAGGSGINPPGSTPPATPNSYTIIAPLATTISVGTGQPYTSLTNTGGLFDAINNGALGGNTTVTIISDLTGETGTVALGPLPDGGSNYTLTIQSDGTLRNVTGTATNAAGMIRLVGASRVIFDGQQPGNSQNLRFSNTTASAPTFSLTADASSNKLTWLIAESANTSATSGTIVVGNGTTTGSSLNEFTVVDIRSTNNATTATYANGIYSTGLSSTVPNGPNYVYYSSLHNFSGSGVYLAGTNNNNWVVAGNSLYQEAARSAALIPVRIVGGNNHTVQQNNIYQVTGTISAAFTGISIIGGGNGHVVSGNFIGGAAAGAASGTLTSSSGGINGIVLTVGTTTASSVQGNVIRGMTSTSTSSNSYGINVTAGAVNVGGTTGNIIGSATASQGFTVNYDATAINVVSSTLPVVISNNEVRNLQTGSGAITGLYLTGIATSGSNALTMASNTISGLTGTTIPDESGGFNSLTRGILCTQTGVVTVQGNQLTNIGSTAATASASYLNLVAALVVSGQAATSQVTRNRIWNVYSSSSGTGSVADQVYGMSIAGTSTLLANNQVSLATGTATAPVVFGIYENGTTNTYAFNSVYLAGAGSSSTYGLYRAGTTTGLRVRNNIFYNARTGSGSNYAIATASTTGFTGSLATPANNVSDYNLFFASDATKVGLYGSTGYSFAGWKSATSGDGSSMSETSATVPAASLFTSTSTGDLSLLAANSAAWYANGTGTQLTTVATDYVGATRPTTVAAGAPDIGSTEVTPSSMPPALTATPAAPVLGGTQIFTLGGRTLASFAYGSTLASLQAGNTGRVTAALPSLVVGRYYSGTNPPAPFTAGAKYANMYFDFSDANTDGSGYTYQPTLTYDPALLGTIATESAQRISQRLADNSGYQTAQTTIVNPAPTRTLVGPSLFNRFSIFAISDAAAPLPVELTAFAAVRQGSNAALSWTTASEVNNQGFEVQVSPDGTTFRKLGFVAGAGSSQVARSYAFLDQESGKAGLRYYRLRQVDLDGTASFSPVRTVQFEAPAEVAVHALPNPFGGSLAVSLTLPAASAATVVLTDALGRVVLSQNLGLLPAGTSQPALSGVADLPAGMYLLRATVAGSVHTIKVVKE